MHNLMLTKSVCVASFLLILHAGPLHAQAIPEALENFEKTEAMIAMRDRVRLYTEICKPKTASAALPILLLRTPYGAEGWPARAFTGYLKELAEEGYIFVFQDIRGRYKSEGQFVMMRPPRDRQDPHAVDESTDAYDTIAWLLQNVPGNNGRVGALGISYGGWLTVMAMLDPHPAMKAVSPQASPADMFLGDDFHHNGAFRLSYGFEYAVLMESSNINTSFDFDEYDTFEWYLTLGPLSNANAKYLHGKLPTWNDYIAHPNYDGFWQKQAIAPYLQQVKVPTLNVAGWYDQEDFYGPLKIYEALEGHDAQNLNYLVVGPWNHGGWSRGEGNTLGKIDFESGTSKYFREKIQAPWFAYFLKDRGKLEFAEAQTFRMGTNQWTPHEHWPPRKNAAARNIYFQENGKLSFEAPQQEDKDQFDSYISDPDNPVPYRNRPIEPTYYAAGSGWYNWLTEDQRFVHRRPDVLSWESDSLREALTISGNILANLFASTTGTDGDWIVKLIDVYPEKYAKDLKMSGYQQMIANEVLRGRFRKSFDQPLPMTPNQVEKFAIDLHSIDHTFLPGHRIMVQVQSTWFPVIDRNPQKYVDNIFTATESDYQVATQRVYRSKTYASHVTLPVIK